LIRDKFFTLRTDHANLLYLGREDTSPKVLRWKLAIQEFNFHIEHISGVKNIAADVMSRMLDRQDLLDTSMVQSEAHMLMPILEEFKIPDDKYRLIGNCHNSVVGHLGVDMTCKKLQDGHGAWPYMRKHVDHFITKCPCCQKMSQIKAAITTRPYTTATLQPMDRIAMDTIGPLPESAEGDQYILVIIDCLTRFVELYACKSADADAAAKCLLDHLGRYGSPYQIQTDKGSQFVNKTIDKVLELIGTEHVISLAHSKEENAIVERANKEVLRHLNGIIYDKNVIHDWPNNLPLVQRIMNSTIHSSTGVSPAQMLFGNAVSLDKGLFEPTSLIKEREETTNISEWIDKRLAAQATILRVAKEHQEAKDAQHIADNSGRVDEFAPGTYVLTRYPQVSTFKVRGPPTKFHTLWKGPLRVVSSKGARYTLINLVTNETEDTHVTNLKEFLFDADKVDPKAVAYKDDREFIIEKVVAHEGNPKVVSTLMFKVRWAGYDEKADVWVPWKEVRLTSQLHEYLRQNRLARLIPRKLE
jgi:hypothetical protein